MCSVISTSPYLSRSATAVNLLSSPHPSQSFFHFGLSRIISLSSPFSSHYSRKCLLKPWLGCTRKINYNFVTQHQTFPHPNLLLSLLPPPTPALAIIVFVSEHTGAIKWALCVMFSPQDIFLGRAPNSISAP